MSEKSDKHLFNLVLDIISFEGPDYYFLTSKQWKRLEELAGHDVLFCRWCRMHLENYDVIKRKWESLLGNDNKMHSRCLEKICDPANADYLKEDVAND